MLVRTFVVALLVSSSLGAGSAFASPAAGLARPLRVAPQSQFIKASKFALAPFAFVRFCKDNGGSCEAGSGDAEVSLTPALRAELLRINSTVNRTIIAQSDDDDNDVWAQDVIAGDCEDFALTKRHRLVKAGWPTRSLRIAVAKTRNGEGHAVLVVRTSEGDLVLDNRTSAVRTWNQTDLKWIKIQSGDDPRLWYDI
ncbi:transglutaminase-like cysteine peptidase [Rhizobium sp.]|uniref:transglutaminase-like cysteine peptidase n=1 Tax=Rhizobium sp. TaxID=391 RepID=UPI0028B1DD13